MATVDCPEKSCYRKTWAGPSIGNHRLAYDLMVRTEPLEFRLAGKGCQEIFPSSCTAILTSSESGQCGRWDSTLSSACNVYLLCTYSFVQGGTVGAAGRHDRIPRIQSVRPCPDGVGTTTCKTPEALWACEPVKLGCLEYHLGD